MTEKERQEATAQANGHEHITGAEALSEMPDRGRSGYNFRVSRRSNNAGI